MSTAMHVSSAQATSPGTRTHVTGRRVIATIVDGLLFGAAYLLLAWAFGDIRVEGEPANWDANLSAGWNIAYGVSVVAYYVLMEGYLGQTVGKWATGVTVVSEATGRAPGVTAAALRTVLRLIDGLFSYAVAFVVTLASDRRQRLGDVVAHTLVIRRAARSGGR
ncbi:MAG TPA: RDD family protein [Actinoplanes sp.]|nr:RDD family protein [Actinoplanes sp.]